MSKRYDITVFAALVAFLGILMPNLAMAMGACIEPGMQKGEVDQVLDYLESARSDEAALMSLRADARSVATEPDCSTLDEDTEADPAYAACYDSVDLPVSTIPSLFAEHQADEASGGVLGKVGDILGKSVEPTTVEPDPNEASVEMTPAQRLRQAWRQAAQSLPQQHEPICTTQSPDNCRAAPALPSLWIPEVSSPVAANELFAYGEDRTEPTDESGVAPQRVAALNSVALDVPVPPPR